MIDLHCHSTASDGTDRPAELVRNAVSAGLTAIAITDHDTTAGWGEAASAVLGLDVAFTLLRGAEFSCVYARPGQRPVPLHLLGYLFDPEAVGLKAERARLRASRLGRGEAIVGNLVAAGYPIDWERVREIADGGSVGRPHIGQALQERGVVGSVSEAFDHLLASDSPWYVPKADADVLEMIGLIRQAGGVPVIAHPWARSRGLVVDEQALHELADAGMLGIEVDHADHVAADRARLSRLADELGLIRTGSSDYHGDRKAVRLGAERTDSANFQRLLDQAFGVKAVYSPGAC
jgi:predicted metal-dependent phosphoesterase TrpH